MPLSARRRHKPSKTPSQSKEQTPEIALPGMSSLEQLPLELLTQIFIYSQNKEFIFTSKSLYERLGVGPSEWLVMEFFKPAHLLSIIACYSNLT